MKPCLNKFNCMNYTLLSSFVCILTMYYLCILRYETVRYELSQTHTNYLSTCTRILQYRLNSFNIHIQNFHLDKTDNFMFQPSIRLHIYSLHLKCHAFINVLTHNYVYAPLLNILLFVSKSWFRIFKLIYLGEITVIHCCLFLHISATTCLIISKSVL